MVRTIEITEDIIHVLVWVLLAVIGLLIVVDTVHHVADVVTDARDLQATVIAILERTLLLFIVAELLHTVAIAVEHRGALDPLPFLVVAMVAAIRSVLIVTAEAEPAFQWNPQGIELLILMALILVLALTAVIWRNAVRFEADELRVVAHAPEEVQGDRRDSPQGSGAQPEVRRRSGGPG